MSEYWKSTPKYWCKYCNVYVRDTKFERTNHEATAKHQGGLKRFLRDLHRDHEKGEREKDRVKREIERLNGVVGTSSGSTAASSSSGPAGVRATPQTSTAATEAQRKKQWEQLADMGIDVPTELRGDMAMASEWTVTNTRIIDDTPKTDEDGNIKVEAVATGVRKRSKPEDEEEREEAMKDLFKKPRKWGRDTKQAPEEDAELDALLGGSLGQLKLLKKEKLEDTAGDAVMEEKESPVLKKEPSDDGPSGINAVKSALNMDTAPVKKEEGAESEANLPALVFKKRKPKNIRQK